MTTIEFLKQGKDIQKAIDSLKMALERTRAQMTSLDGLDYAKDRVQSSPTGDARIVNSINKVIRLESRLKEEIARLSEFTEDALSIILQLPNQRLRAVLIYKYIDFFSFREIAEKLDISERHVYSLHAEAIKSVVLPEKYIKM